NKEWIYPYRETDVLGGHDPYSASKACAELVINSYVHSFFSPQSYQTHQKAIASTRAGNVIGGGDWAKDRIIPDIVKSLMQNQPVAVRNPLAVRPWQHVLEPLGGYLALGSRLATNAAEYGGAWNFGPLLDDNKKVAELVETAIQLWQSGSFQTPDLQNQPHEAKLLKLDISKAMDVLGWMPKYNSKTAIEKTIEWYKYFMENKDGIKAFSVNQIREYERL
ncbi:MAG TPA: CDP-glucose 4,6-dehydratase, partial [Niastella sp.]|nr:CDP-glucose 4,6-dehydratase [Niastella sp.]